jgi:hypothetical protein
VDVDEVNNDVVIRRWDFVAVDDHDVGLRWTMIAVSLMNVPGY